jgi:serine/threonine protein kinase
MHSKGIIHRDLKLENILTCANEVKLADFGVAKYCPQLIDPASDFKLYDIAGTPGFIAPEVYRQKGYNLKADAYSLGVLIYESTSGTLPDTGEDFRKPIVTFFSIHALH